MYGVPVTSGTRRVALTRIKSLVPLAEHRELLFDMRQALGRRRASASLPPELAQLAVERALADAERCGQFASRSRVVGDRLFERAPTRIREV